MMMSHERITSNMDRDSSTRNHKVGGDQSQTRTDRTSQPQAPSKGQKEGSRKQKPQALTTFKDDTDTLKM